MREQSPMCSQLGGRDRHNEISITSGFLAPEIVRLTYLWFYIIFVLF